MRLFLTLTAFIVPLLASAQQFTFEPAGDKGLTIATVTEKGGTWVLREGIKDNYNDYYAVNLPEEFQREGIEVVFKGTLGKIPANVRLMGRPVELTMIKRLYRADVKDESDDMETGTKERDSIIRVENVEGKVYSETGRWYISGEDSKEKVIYAPENLPEDFMIEDLSVTFTGMVRVPKKEGAIRPLRITDMVAYEETSAEEMDIQEAMKDYFPFDAIGKVEAKAGIIRLMGDVYIFETDNGTTRYLPAFIPEEFRQDRVKVLVTGYYGEIPANVRMMGIPFEITSIEAVE